MAEPADPRQIAQQLDSFLKPESEQRQARTRERILHAATDLFVTHGYRKTSVEEVAGAAGVAKGTIYLYYRNKAELLVHSILRQKQQYLMKLAPVSGDSATPKERLRTLVRVGIMLGREMPLMSSLVSGDHVIEQVLRDVDRETLVQMNEQQIEFLASLIEAASGHVWERAQLEERAEALLDLMFAVVNGGRQVPDGMPLEAYASLLADIIVGGIVEPPPS